MNTPDFRKTVAVKYLPGAGKVTWQGPPVGHELIADWMASVSYLMPSPAAPKSVTEIVIGIGLRGSEMETCDWMRMKKMMMMVGKWNWIGFAISDFGIKYHY